ncbi:MAG: 2-oxoglutarate and iron-dependent oxygenase domain-containing protein [Myxococcaceae bacterium]
MTQTRRRIPLVSLHDYTHGTAQERERFVRVFGEGLREFGFVSVKDHGIPDDLIRRTYADVERFFALPTTSKSNYAVPGLAGKRGFTPFGREHARNRTVGDLKEFWHVGRDFPPGEEPPLGYGRNVWPVEVPSFRENTRALYAALDGAAATMLEALAEWFAVPRSTFRDMANEGDSVLRLIHYPPLGNQFEPGAVRAAEHEDINLLTLLCEGTAPGLELLTRDGEWIPVDTLKGQIVVDSGDMLSRVTNGIIPATTHRVVNPPSADLDATRYSMPFFVHPWPECVLQPLPSTETAENPARYPPITANDFLVQRLREIGLIK